MVWLLVYNPKLKDLTPPPIILYHYNNTTYNKYLDLSTNFLATSIKSGKTISLHMDGADDLSAAVAMDIFFGYLKAVIRDNEVTITKNEQEFDNTVAWRIIAQMLKKSNSDYAKERCYNW